MYAYWGKCEDLQSEQIRFHRLVYHLLDVASVGEALLDSRPDWVRSYSRILGLSEQSFKSIALFFLAIHDLGKFGGSFQGIAPQLARLLGADCGLKSYSTRHDALGLKLWERSEFKQDLVPDTLDFDLKAGLDNWAITALCHHGKPTGTGNVGLEANFSLSDERAASKFANWAKAVFWGAEPLEPHSSLEPEVFEQKTRNVSWWLAGLAVLSDWLGSSTDFFPFESKIIPLQDYHKRAQGLAQRAVQQSGLAPCEKTSGLGVLQLFGFKANPMQSWAESLPLPSKQNLIILENLTGSGKTEAALVLCHRLMGETGATGLFFGLPTLATANGMYPRMSQVYSRFFTPGSTPSCVLAHSQKQLNPDFLLSLEAWSPAGSKSNASEETASMACASWLAESNKRALLAEVGVGTLDQALLGVLFAKHQSLRLLGLGGKVLVVDEVHAYDDYMLTCLELLLQLHAFVGGSAILLSATLPQKLRGRLLSAYAKGANQLPPQPLRQEFPLATHWSPLGLRESPMEAAESRDRPVVRLDDEASMLEVILAAQERGQSVCWVRNTVKTAQETYGALSRKIDASKLTLFHARFAQEDRQRIEAEVLHNFGKKSGNQDRSGKVLIATQVIESSLDLDFDLMLSDLAPIDLLIQRAGRQYRHRRDVSGNPCEGQDQRPVTPFYLFAPDPKGEISADWIQAHQSGSAFLYNQGHLWLTAKLLEDTQALNLPQQARLLVESVYSDYAVQAVPEALAAAVLDREGKDFAKKGMAKLNCIDFNEGYQAVNEAWDAEEQAPTRLGQDSMNLYLARWQEGGVVPYAEGQQAWERSRLSVRTHWLSDYTPSLEVQTALDVLLTQQPQVKYGKVAVLNQSRESPWPLEGLALAYDPKIGLFQTSNPNQNEPNQ